MSPTASEQITVSGSPVVDVTSNIQGANITSETMRSLPLGRNFVAAAQVAPVPAPTASYDGVRLDWRRETNYIIDGLTRGRRARLQGKRLNPRLRCRR